MAKRRTHNKDCMMLFGKTFDHVHAWLDQFAFKYPISDFLDYHRTYYHNRYGLEYIRLKWGPKAERAGRIHLLRDTDWLMVRSPEFDDYREEEIWKMCDKAIMYFNYIDDMGPDKHYTKMINKLIRIKQNE